jgi:RimJ/RimL family protein N-acetyltransferase
VAVLHAELYDDVPNQARSDSRPWRPITLGTDAVPTRVRAPEPTFEPFSVVELATDELAGEAVVWAIDLHNRSAHLGLALRPAYRGRGLGTDLVRTLCQYGFAVRGFHRLQLETLSDNIGMLTAATNAGFTVEGTLRGASWVMGEFLDDVVLGLLAENWKPS